MQGVMDQKSWLWKKRSSEKAIIANVDEVQSLPIENEVDIENPLKLLQERLDSVLDECSAKDQLVHNYEKIAESAVADKNKAEEELRRLKEELDEALHQKVAADERLGELNSALKDSMSQLQAARKEHEQSKDSAKAREKLEEKLAETSKKLADLTVESSYLSKAVHVKDNLIADLSNSKYQTEAEFEALMARLDSVEKENAFLRYEFRALEKELDLRNEELVYNRRSSEALQKKHFEDVKKIKRIEAECQRLRSLTRKRLPGSAAFVNIRGDFEVKGRSNVDQKLVVLIDHVKDLENETKILNETLARKDEEILCLVKNNSSLLQAKVDLPKASATVDLYGSMSSRSWASDLISGQEGNKLRSPQTALECKVIGASDMSLMDDFVEMEKLAIVAVDTPLGSSFNDSDVSRTVSNLSKNTYGDISMSKELVLVEKSSCESLKVDLNSSIGKIIELIDKFVLRGSEDHNIEQSSVISDYKIRAFCWKNSELTSVAQKFVHSCCLILNGKIGFEKFAEDLTSTLQWIIDDSISYQNRLTIKDEFKKHLGGEGPGTAMELDSVRNLMFEIEKTYSTLQVEIEGLKAELNSISRQPQESIEGQQNELDLLKESKRVTEDQVEHQKQMNDELETQLSVTKSKLHEVQQKLSSVEVELESKNQFCHELEETCLDLQLKLESANSNRNPENDKNEENLPKTDVEIMKASVKLSESEQTILYIGNQLQTLGSAKELSVVDKVLSVTDNNNASKFKHRPSLRDQLLTEDGAHVDHLHESPETKEIISTRYHGPKHERKDSKSLALVVVPTKRRGGMGFLAKLLLKRKKAALYYGK